VAEHIRIGMSVKPMAVRDLHAAKDQRAAFCETVNVVSDADHGF
jgi:hypothetical protein